MNLLMKRMNNKKLLERASEETFYDSIKWVMFGLFAIIYFGLKENNFWNAILFLAIFVITLFLINVKREKSLEKIEKYVF